MRRGYMGLLGLPNGEGSGDEGHLEKIRLRFSFPRGQKQIEEESGQICSLLGGRFGLDEARDILVRAKVSLVGATDISEDGVIGTITTALGNKLTLDEARVLFQFFAGRSGPLFTGGDGSSRDRAVVVNSKLTSMGIPAEYGWIHAHYGTPGGDWIHKGQSLIETGEKKLDEIVIELRDGSQRAIYFDVSSFFGTL
jgi:hypothetical protein